MEILSIPAILAIVEAFKMIGLPSKYAAIMAIGVGLLFGFIVGSPVAGMVFGLSASGLYSGIKKVVVG
jgi:hypothetical protein